MPNLSDDPERPSTVPQPELNPLLNPVLGKNMGRWAEVYFTSPPEKREEAVLQLIRELEDEGGSAQAIPDGSTQRPFQTAPARAGSMYPAVMDSVPPESQLSAPSPGNGSASRLADQSQGNACFWCGYINQPGYRFCGRCGESLTSRPVAAAQEKSGDRRNDRSSNMSAINRDDKNDNDKDQGQRADRNQQDIEGYNADRRDRQRDTGSAQDDEEARMGSSWSADSVPRILPSLDPVGSEEFLQRRMDYGTSRLQSESSSRSLRPWIATVLAMGILAAAFVAWRKTSYRASSPAVASPATANSSQTAQTATPTPEANEPAPAVPAAKAPPVAASPVSSTAVPEQTAAPLAGKGAAELDQARDFLDGRNGKERNNAEAAEWLWRAVRKENVDATVLLAGLYLRGDGVAKNCDQARLLLDAAAIKGRKDAAEQLQHLPAFGCQ